MALHKILIVDDDHDTHRYIADLLQMYGYEAGCVHRSDHARALIPNELPDLLILDLHIEQPYAGWLLLQELRADAGTKAIPAILATSDSEFVRTHKDAVRAHGGELLPKPFAPDELLARVHARLGSAA